MSEIPGGFRDHTQSAGGSPAPQNEESLFREVRDGLKHLRGPKESHSGQGGVVLIGFVRNGSGAGRFLEHNLLPGVRHAVSHS